MKEVKASQDFSLNGEYYIKGDTIEGLDLQTISKLNEKGFIEPLTYKDLILMEREMKKPKKEVIKDGNDTK